jgi:hypothetical protein
MTVPFLVFNYVVEENPDDPHQNTEDTSYFLFKVGGTISPDTKPLQGTWNWYMHGSDKSYIRSRIIPDFDNDSPNSLTRGRDPFN